MSNKIILALAFIIGFVAFILFTGDVSSAGGLRLGQTVSGDTNCDGRVLATDALATLRIVTGIDPALTVREACK